MIAHDLSPYRQNGIATADRWDRLWTIGGEVRHWVSSAWEARARPAEAFAGPYSLAGHTVEIRGRGTRVAEVSCEGVQPLLIASGTLLWREPGLAIAPDPSCAGESGVGLEVTGQGRLACASPVPGWVFMLYLPGDRSIMVQPDRWLCAAGLRRQPVRLEAGTWMDRFYPLSDEGLLLLWAAGNTYELMLEAGETLLLHPGSLLYKAEEVAVAQADGGDSSPALPTHALRCTGPGLLAVQTGMGMEGWP
jgi:uncharacterized protein (AIM24 family)